MLDNYIFYQALDQLNDALAIFDNEDLQVGFVNDAMRQLWRGNGLPGDDIFYTPLSNSTGQPVTTILKKVWHSGEAFKMISVPTTVYIDGLPVSAHFDLEFKALKGNNGKTIAVVHTAINISKRIEAADLADKSQAREASLTAELKLSNSDKVTANDNLLRANTDLQTSYEKIDKLNIRLDESETDFRRLVEKAPVAIIVFRGKDLVVDLVNDAMLEIIDKDRSVIGKPLLEAMPEIRRTEAADQLFEVFNTGLPSDGQEAPVPINRHGRVSTRYFNFSYRPLLDQGKIVGVMDIAVDVTEQVLARKHLEDIVAEKTQLEKTLRASEQRLQSILDTMAEGVGIIDTTGQLVYANGMAQRILGLAESQIKARTYHDPKWTNLRLDGSTLPENEHPMAIMMRTGQPVYDHEIGVQPTNGKRFYISINAAPIFDEENKLTGGIGTFMDVTTRRELSQQKDDFISIASHELKTPVTSLKASLQLLSRGRDSLPAAMRDKLVDQSVRSLDKLNGLINELLNTNKLSHERFAIKKSTFLVNDLISSSCQHINMAKSHDVQLTGRTDMEITGDEQLLEQVIVNLLNNAVKYAPDSKKIIVSTDIVGDVIKIAVTDFGPGIPSDQVEHIFERYYQAQESKGLGLGLYICAEIIQKHGGAIGVDSKPNNGSTFWFTLPLR